MDTNTTTSGGGPASVLGNLKARRETIIEKATKDLPVPRWSDPEIYVRFRPVDHDVIRKGQRAIEKAPDKDKARREVEVNSDLLIRGCVGVYALIDGQEYSLRSGDHEGELTTFDADLAENLGVGDNVTARATVKALYMFDGDILHAAGEVMKFSGYTLEEANERVVGE